MFAVYAAAPNPESPLDALVVGERPAPEAPEGWVPVTVTAASLNMHDIWTLRGVGIKPDQFPMILGCDGAGTLPDGSPVVLHSIIGDPAWFGDETLDPRRNMLTERHQGAFADTVVVPARNAVPMPEGLTPVQAAVMGTAWLTAYRMLFVKSGLRPGQTMLVQGATGGVSTALVQLGVAAGMCVWVTGRTQEKQDVAATAGRTRHVPERRPAARARRRGLRDRRRGHVGALHARAQARRCDRCLRLDERPFAECRSPTAVLPAAPRHRLHHGHARRAR